MVTEGSNNMFGPPHLKKASLFGNLQGIQSPTVRKSLNTSGARSELGFAIGAKRPNLKGGKKGNTTNMLPNSPSKGNNFDKSSILSRYSYMSANTVFLQYRSNQIYF